MELLFFNNSQDVFNFTFPTIAMKTGFIKLRLGFINRSFFNGKGITEFCSEEFRCIKRLNLLTVDALTESHCIKLKSNTRIESHFIVLHCFITVR